MVMVISRKSTETRKGCHSVSVLFSMVVIISFVPIFVAGLCNFLCGNFFTYLVSMVFRGIHCIRLINIGYKANYRPVCSYTYAPRSHIHVQWSVTRAVDIWLLALASCSCCFFFQSLSIDYRGS